jgi:hypothetical protein
MKVFILFVGWCILFAISWPLAILAIFLFPLVWLLLIPFRLVGFVLGAILALLRGILYLPARLLSGSKPPCPAQ